MMKNLTRREFLDLTAKGAAAATLGGGALEEIFNPSQAQAANQPTANKSGVAEQVLSLPKGGGAIKGLGEKFQPDLHTGTGNFSLPIQTPPGRNGFQPQLSLQYSTGAGNGPFGLGWNLGVPNVMRETAHGIPVYDDEKDTFILSGAEDLVPVGGGYYRPRTEGLFARIRKINAANGQDCWWEVASKNGIRSVYGDSDESRVYTIEGGRKKIFQWLLSKTEDPAGNRIVYHYQRDQKPARFADPELQQTEANHEYNQVYLQSIAYLNFRENGEAADQHFVRIELDYGEYDENGNLARAEAWGFRPDRFSSNRAGFEIRTVRRCNQILIKVRHENEKGRYHLVKRYTLEYRQSPYSNISLLHQITLWGHHQEEKKSFPPITFDYTKFAPENRRYESLRAQGDYLPPKALSDPNFELIDLTGNGLPDVLHTSPTGFTYWQNMGDGLFLSPQKMVAFPAGVLLEQSGVQFADMEGTGAADLLITNGVTAGYYRTNFEAKWERPHLYQRAPEFSFEDPNTKFVDLDGDGVIDVLRATDKGFLYFHNNGKKGWDDPIPIRRQRDSEQWPDVYFDNPRVRLADMTGDGMQDIVYIHHRRIEYWANYGHGKWGKRMTMFNAPELEPNYDPARLFLSDVNGDGLADLIYAGFNQVTLWINQSGNGWSEPITIHGTPPTGPASVRTADMKGSGTPGLLWTYDYSLQQPKNYKYFDFTGGEKPLLLNRIDNNIGAETQIDYKPSTHFWVEDEKANRRWKTHLPFPVQVVAKVEMFDHISQTRLASVFRYHHGYYDGREREFRGFGLTEQLDTETFSDHRAVAALNNVGGFAAEEKTYVPPALTKTWFHIGIVHQLKEHADFYREEYYAEDTAAYKPHTVIEPNDAPDEAMRALRGQVLRSEVYALDGTASEKHPYVVTENGYRVQLIQAKGNQAHGVFLTYAYESFTFHYERNSADPRIAQSLVHEIDRYGNITKSLSIAYPRRVPAFDEQAEYHITYSQNEYINQDRADKPYFIGYLFDSKQIEIKLPAGVKPSPLLPEAVAGLEIDGTQHNLFSHTRNYYDGPPFTGLSLGQIGEHGLLTRSETLVLKAGQVAAMFGDKLTKDDLLNAGYVEDADRPGQWWVQTQRTEYDAARYSLPVAQKDPLGHVSRVNYDRFSFLPEKIADALDNEITAQNDYFVLGPYRLTDFNGNRTEVVFDALGLVVKTAVMGEEGLGEGDSIDHPTTKIDYELFRFREARQPIFAKVQAREAHHRVNSNPRWLETYVYSDGFGREIQAKAKAAPGEINGVYCEKRWVGSGWKVYNNKGWVVEQYEPFFSCEFEYSGEVKIGVAAKMIYDPLGRVVRTDHPDGTFSRVEFDPWRQTSFDANDTVEESDWYARLHGSDKPLEKRTAEKALAHKNTPAVAHLDTLGRSFLTIEDNGAAGKYETRSKFDFQGNVLEMKDPRDNVAFRHQFDLSKNVIHRWQMDSGARFSFLNAAGNPVKKWDSHKHVIESLYDELNRPVELWLTDGTGKRRLAEKILYGEKHADPKSKNLRGEIYQQHDESGVVTFAQYDFKGNLQKKTRQIREDYKNEVDWNASPSPVLAADLLYENSYEYDALNRIISANSPDGSVYLQEYNEAGLLNAVKLTPRGSSETIEMVKRIDYNARGQRAKIEYGNEVVTEYQYDSNNFRLIQLISRKGGSVYQHDLYAYDPVGNITFKKKLSTMTACYDNAVITGDNEYSYDAVYRLISATGRELRSNTVYNRHEDFPYVECGNASSDTQAQRPYTQEYVYDSAGNISFVKHTANGGSWRRRYEYDASSNRLQKTFLGSSDALELEYQFDEHGNHTNFLHLRAIQWDFKDQMRAVDLMGGGTAYYLYDAGGMRVRKVIENTAGVMQKEVIYLDNFETLRTYAGGTVREEIETLHIMDDQKRVALVETRTKHEGRDETPSPKFRYQLTDHLGSAVFELSEEAKFITHEEYYPYGGTSYHETNTALGYYAKRYRYSGKEKDEETGLYYYGARYYIPWLRRWINCDPGGMVDGTHLYRFSRNNPVVFHDRNGYYSETGHYYTSYYVALAAGLEHDDACNIAFYSQMPDEVKELDAIATETNLFAANINSTIASIGTEPVIYYDLLRPYKFKVQFQRDISHKGLHALTGGEAVKERDFRANEAMTLDIRSFIYGISIHAFADSYAHTILNENINLYKTGTGHLWHFTKPDKINERPSFYRDYVFRLFSIFSERAKSLGLSPKITDKQLSAFIEVISMQDSEEKQIEYFHRLISNLLKRNNMGDIDEYRPENEDAVSFGEFNKKYPLDFTLDQVNEYLQHVADAQR